MGSAAEPVVRRRPRDRRERIVEVAGGLFRDRGYRQVGMADVAAGVEIGASALYRHFRGKADLLVAVLDAALTRFEAATGPARTADELLAAWAAVQLAHREYPALWERAAEELPADARSALRARRERLRGRLSDAERGADRGSEPESTDPLVARSRAAWAVVQSPSHHHIEVAPEAGVPLLREAADRCLAVSLPSGDEPADGAGVPRPGGVLLPAARGEALVAVASRLFAERGYHAVSLSEIGAAAGIAGPSIYNHFPSKADLLTVILNRGNEALWFALQHALAVAGDPEQALGLLLDGHLGVLSARPGVVPVLLKEVPSLPPEPGLRLRETQQRYIAEWVTLVRSWRPERPEPAARLLVHAAFAVANSLTRVDPGAGERPPPSSWVRTLASAALGLPTDPH